MIETKWFAVCTRSGWEKRVTISLAKRKIEHYCPLNKVQKNLSERKKVILEPLFATYVFVKLNEKEQATVLQTTGIINFVYWLGQPVVIQDEEIASIKQFLDEYSQAGLEKTRVNLSDVVKVIRDPLMMRKGNLLEVRNSAVKVLLPSLGYTLTSELRKEYIEETAAIGDEGLKVSV